ncbi:MAG: hypothetical protein AABY22_28080 [Nanoarchaeota archaeon]
MSATVSVLRSEIPGVSDPAWTRFVLAMKMSEPSSVSPSRSLGMFEMTPRRLADLGLVGDLKRVQEGGRTVWSVKFCDPLTPEAFLEKPSLQYRAFATSMREYAREIASGDIGPPVAMSRSAALAVLHRAGPSGLDSWVRGERFPHTERAVERAQGIF